MAIFVIDTFNLLYKFTDLHYKIEKDELDSAKAGIFEILSQFREKHPADEFLLFVDGKKQRGDETLQEEIRGLRIYYSLEKKADELILAYIREYPVPSRLTLVTTDKEIRQFAKRLKVKLITSEDFFLEIQETLSLED